MAMPVLTVEGVEQNGLLRSLRYSKTANAVGSMRVEIDSEDGSYRPDLGDVVILEDGLGSRLFGGYADDVEETGIRGEALGSAITNRLDVLHFASIVDRTVVNGTYPAGTLKSWLVQMIGDGGYPQTGLTLHPSQADGPTLTADVTYKTARTRAVLDEWSKLSGWVWEVDDYSQLRMKEPGSASASFDISDGDGNTEGDIVVKPTRSEYWNRVYVHAGDLTALAQDLDEIADHGPWVQVVNAPAETSTAESVQQLADAFILASTPILKQVQFGTPNVGMLPGDALEVVLVDRDVNNTFLVISVDTAFQPNSDRLFSQVTVIEGLVYKPGWREQTRQLFGSGGTSVAAGFVGGGGGGSASARFAYPLGGEQTTGIRAIDSLGWQDVSPMQVQVNTVPRGTTSAQVVVMLKSLTPGVTVQARIYDVTAGAPVSGTSNVIDSQDWERDTFTVTLNAGSHYYKLQVLPSAVDEDVYAMGYLE